MNNEPERLVNVVVEKIEETPEDKERFDKFKSICNHLLTLFVIMNIVLYTITSLRGYVLEGEPSGIFFSKADVQIQEQVETYLLKKGITSEEVKIEITGGFEHYSAMKQNNQALSISLLVKGGALVTESFKPRILYWCAAAFMYFVNGYNIEHMNYDHNVFVYGDNDEELAIGTCTQFKGKVYCDFER